MDYLNLWEQLGDVPINDNDEIEEDFLHRINQQIKNRLIALAEKRYMSAFTLQLAPLKEKVIESKIETSNNEKSDIQVKRKQILYELGFSDKTPKPISDFDVVIINEMKPNKVHPYCHSSR